MWSKTFAGFLLGLFLSMSIVLNLNLILPFNVDTLLILGLLLAFPIWVITQVWCYASESRRQAWYRGTKLLLPSVCLNFVLLYFG